MIEKIQPLSIISLQILSETYEIVTFSQDHLFVSKDLIPLTALVLLEGEIQLSVKDRVEKTIFPHNALGIYEILNEKASSYDCTVLAGSKVIVIGKSDLLNAKKKSELYKLIKLFARN